MANPTTFHQYSSTAAALLVAAFVAPSRALLAQGNLPSPGCSYDQCALRLEGNRILRGASGERVGKLGVFSAANLSALVSAVPSDSALAHARIFDANYGQGSRLLFGGVLTAVVALTVDRARRDQGLTGGSWAPLAIASCGIVIEFVGARKVVRARDAFSRAIWWHNRELPR